MTNPYQAPSAPVGDIEAAKPNVAPPSGPHGIGGWLILVVIGLVVSPIRALIQIDSLYEPMVRDGGWTTLTTPGEANYHPLWAPLLIYEAIGNMAIIVVAVITLIFLFRHSRHTPKLAIAWYAFGMFFVVSDYFLADLIPIVATQPDPETLKEVVRSVIAATIWIPYFKVSKRVKATFVK